MKARNRKKLATLVAMALSIGVGVGINPTDAYAQVSVKYDGSTYTVTYDTDAEHKILIATNGADALNNIKTAIKYNTTGPSTLEIRSYKQGYDVKDLVNAFEAGGTTFEFVKGQSYTLYLYGDDAYTITAGDNTTIECTANQAFVLGGSGAEVSVNKNATVTVNSTAGSTNTIVVNNTSEINKTDNAKVIVTGEDGGTVNLSGEGTVSQLTVNNSATITGTSASTNVYVADGKTLTSAGSLTVGSISGSGNINTGANDLTVSGDISANSITSGGAVSAENITSTGDVVASSITATGAVTAYNITTKALDISGEGASVNVDGALNVNGTLKTGTNTITAETVKLGSSTKIDGATDKVNINANSISIDKTAATTDVIYKLTVKPSTAGQSVVVKVTGLSENDTVSSEVKAAIQTAAGENVVISASNTAMDDALSNAGTAEANADDALYKINSFAVVDAADVAAANPFAVKLPDANDIAEIGNPSEEDLNKVTALVGTAETSDSVAKAINDLQTQIEKIDKMTEGTAKDDYAQTRKDLVAQKDALEAKQKIMSAEGLKTHAANIRAAVQQRGKTAAAPGIAAARSAAVVTEVMTNNVVARTGELRTLAAAVDDGRPATDNLWFQYKHTNMDVDGGDVYSQSTVKTNNYQLGYDTKIGENDYLGAYIGTTTGSVEFTGPARSGDADIENSFDFGIYGTHMLPANQYIDYMIHRGKFDTKYSGESWGTTDTGAMVGYGAKIAANERLTWNPYVQLAYDKVSVDSYMAGSNKVSSDDSNNWTAKLGINLMDASGFYGGLAYSRGLSGSYNAYINGVPMPTQDNKANVIYLSLGYRAAMSKTVFLDVSAEKTFADYKGWTATGKVNFYF